MIIDELGLRPVINAVGSPTRLGGTRYTERVIAAMAEAARCFVPIHALQERAGEAIVRLTGAEAGCVTTGAAGSLFLGACAILAGDELAWMEALPGTGDRPDEFVVHRAHRSPYDHAVRAAGARLVEFGYDWEGVGAYEWQLEAALGPRTAGVLYVAGRESYGLSLETVCRVAGAHGVPVLVDAAEEVERVRELTRADLVAVSGGKALRGPAGSGILAGRRDLIASAAMQHQDMYTTAELFPGPFAVPGQHGMGRILKVGREQIVGLTVAIEDFLVADHDAEIARCRAVLELIGDGTITQSSPTALPFLSIDCGSAEDAFAIARALLEHDPQIYVDEGRLRFGVLGIGPRNLTFQEAEIVGRALRAARTRT